MAATKVIVFDLETAGLAEDALNDVRTTIQVMKAIRRAAVAA